MRNKCLPDMKTFRFRRSVSDLIYITQRKEYLVKVLRRSKERSPGRLAVRSGTNRAIAQAQGRFHGYLRDAERYAC
jgi:hypothetical protein